MKILMVTDGAYTDIHVMNTVVGPGMEGAAGDHRHAVQQDDALAHNAR